ncbi:tef3, partial [Symbiodinium natans]
AFARRVWASSSSRAAREPQVEPESWYHHQEEREWSGYGSSASKPSRSYKQRGVPLDSLTLGEEVTGWVKSLTSYGAFLDTGAAKDGLLPWSKSTLSQDEVSVGDEIKHLRIESVDLARQRFSLRGPVQEMTWESWQPGKAEVPSEEDPASTDCGWWQHSSWHEGDRWAKEPDDDGWVDLATAEPDDDGYVDVATSALPPEATPSQAKPSREALRQAILRRLDKDEDGYLNCSDLHPFATLTGFVGDPSVWKEEYELLCQEYGCETQWGLDQRSFFSMVDTSSENGCYCSDEELAEILEKLKSSSELTARKHLKCDVFGRFDEDSDGYLNSQEAQAFAEETGFDGDVAIWSEEFRDLCQEARCLPDQGWSFPSFSWLVDQGERGVYCTDEELRLMLQGRKVSNPLPPAPADGFWGPAAAPPGPPGLEPPDRQQLKESVFCMFDSDRDRRLGCEELWAFAQLSPDFGCSEDEWDEAFAELCDDYGCIPTEGLSKEAFFALVDDESDRGCYCTENQLQAMLLHGASAPARQLAGRPRSKGESSKGKGASKGAKGKDPFDEAGDPWAAAAEMPRSKGKEKGKGKAAAEREQKGSKAKGKDKTAPASQRDDPGSKGKGKGKTAPAGQQDDAGFDPWATPEAQRAREKMQQKAKEEKEEVWGKWRDAGKPGVGLEPGTPAVDKKKLLEAVLARKKAVEAAKRVEEQRSQPPEPTQEERPPAPPVPPSVEEDDDEVFWSTEGTSLAPARSSGASASSSAPQLQARRAVTMSAALAGIGAAIAQLAMGDRNAVEELAAHISGAPCVPHAAAVASSALRSLFLGRTEEARTLLALDEVLHIPGEGDVTLLQALERAALAVGGVGAPMLLRTLVPVLAKLEDRHVDVRNAAAAASEALLKGSDPCAFEAILPALKAGLEPRRPPRQKLHALKLLKLCWRRGVDGAAAVAEKLPELLPLTADLLMDTSNEVRADASEATDVLMSLCGNADLEPHLEEIISCVKGKKDVSKCLRDLAEVVFVQRVTAPALAAVLPVLSKGLKSRNARAQRQACVIAENMGRLVSAVADVKPFAPQLLPLLQKVREEVSDPDVRAVAGRAYEALEEVATADRTGSIRKELRNLLDMAVVESEVAMAGALGGGRDIARTPCPQHVRDVVLDHAVLLCLGLGRMRREAPQWRQRLTPLLESVLPGGSMDGPKALLASLRSVAEQIAASPAEAAEDPASESEEEQFPLLCDCTFTLACGAATLLTEARLQLRRGHVYGVVGGNDSGKSTLLRAIHDRRVSGFPPASELRTALVEHGVGERAPDCDQTPVEFLMADPVIRMIQISEAEVVAQLSALGFAQGARLQQPIRMLSGGWRMKLGLARAMLQSAHVVLLDEPTGHLDTGHIDWLVDYIHTLQDDPDRSITVLVVSHDAPFLDRVCTHILHVEGSKLRNYRGNFSTFLERVPNAQLGSKIEETGPLPAFVLPEPGSLEGVRSKGKRFLNLEDVSYTYPESHVPAVKGATVECSLRSRVAIMGPNGAGKSTVAGLVVGELAPDRGTAYRHPNLRMAYVAQHAFHHLEEHLELTATEYILWRFQGNEDREALANRAEEEEDKRADAEIKGFRLVEGQLVPCASDHPQALEPEVIVDRRQRGRLGYEYEMRWRGRPTTSWMSRSQVASIGCLGMAKREDERQAAQRSLIARPLTTPAVQAHLAGFGLSKEEASFRRLGALSSGQRARAVLAASTWLAPHLLVLDEPTNYLDQPALAALAAGLKVFGGGVLIISHTASFVDEVCSERWVMHAGVLRREGAFAREEDEARPAPANAAAQNAAKELKEKRKQKRLKELRRKLGQEVSDDDEEWWEDLLKKANKMKPSPTGGS